MEVPFLQEPPGPRDELTSLMTWPRGVVWPPCLHGIIVHASFPHSLPSSSWQQLTDEKEGEGPSPIS